MRASAGGAASRVVTFRFEARDPGNGARYVVIDSFQSRDPSPGGVAAARERRARQTCAECGVEFVRVMEELRPGAYA